MCGIAGLFNLQGEPVVADRVARMCDLIRHRGPDDTGLFASGAVALGHRRLSIIDLSERGRNPLPNEDKTIWTIANGEIYNYRELRAQLTSRGHEFRSAADTEVLVHLYEEQDVNFITELNGMFAFALWDGLRRRLLLARDRFGVKPLYYTVIGKTLCFASEVKAFLALPEFVPRADAFALAEHFTFQNTFGDRTFFEGVKLLPAGHYLVAENGRIETRCYWDLEIDPDNARTLEDWTAGLRERFEAAVNRQLVSDVPVGSFLSGGMDTGSISAVAVRHISEMHTFTCGFDVPEDASEMERYFDERDESRRLSRLLGTVHHELALGADAMAPVLPRIVWHLDEPRVGISYQIYYTAEMIRRYVKVVLSGVGGDELFAGYPWRYESLLSRTGGDSDRHYYSLCIRFLNDDEKRSLFTDEINHALEGFNTYDSFSSVMQGCCASDPLDRALYFDFKTFLHGLLLVDDKLSMAHSVEGRVPFLDNDLVDYVRRIPAEFKFKPGESKMVLKRAMKGLLPDETLSRRKQGFTPPDQSWYKQRAMGYIRDLILGRRALARHYFTREYLEKILDDHIDGRANNRFLIWSLMCFEWWNRLFIDGEAVPQPVEGATGGLPAKA